MKLTFIKTAMKKYKLLKDIPGENGVIVAGSIMTNENTDADYFTVAKNDYAVHEDVIQNNPEFFEEVTRWKPIDGEDYFTLDLDNDFEIENYTWNDLSFADKHKFNNNLCFKTREQAEHARDEIKKLLLKLHENEA